MFSGTVKLLDLNDYIKPGEECVVLKKSETATKSQKIEVLFDGTDVKSDLIKPNAEQKAEISLGDCLACNGCITTSEALLIQEQSAESLRQNYLKHKFRAAIVTPQSLSSIALHFKISLEEAYFRISSFFRRKFEFDLVLDCLAFVELGKYFSFQEFCKLHSLPSSGSNQFFDYFQNSKEGLAGPKQVESTLICSECPGWVCYLEKVLGDSVIPYASKVKPPQLIAAEMIKNLARIHKKTEEYGESYVVLIAPCFDKKLEASREEMKGQRLVVDLVLSSDEMRQLLLEEQESELPEDYPCFESYDFLQKVTSSSTDLFLASIPRSEIKLYRSFMHFGSSNGYVDYFVRNLCSRNDSGLSITPRKNKNFMEFVLKDENSGKTFTFALVYGFKNLQNFVREVKAKKLKYHYVEAMACPSGCLGGGGQIKSEEKVDVIVEQMKSSLEGLTVQSELQRDMIGKLGAQVANRELSAVLLPEFLEYPMEAVKNKDTLHINW